MKDLALRCSGCGRATAFDPFTHRCGECGEALEADRGDAPVPLLEPAFGSAAARNGAVAGGLWRWKPALPSLDPDAVRRVSMAEGGTPLLRADGLAGELGCRELWLKDEGRNPTASFKDRGTALALAFLIGAGLERVGTVSTGNMARSLAAYAARAGLQATVWVGAATPSAKLAPIVVHGARLLRVEAPYGDIQRASLRWGKAHGVAFVNSDAALRIEGQKTIAYEVGEQLEGRAPDWMLVPTSSGGNLSAIARGFDEAVRFGWLDRMPRLAAVQASGCAPIARAWEQGQESPVPVGPPQTVAGAISNPTPPSGARALRWLRRCDGTAVAVDDERILAAQRRLAAATGRFAQPASAASLAGLEALRERRDVSPDDRVVLLLTGAGGNAPPPDIVVGEPVSLEQAMEAD